ncbi:MAG: glycogen/starch/alpha-glucan family phosphorylase [Lachnospiraceae bacterium]|nr:glycogen/starch/alpha-glucan family phosphorylase [Lachnospiraceae bacterium]
MKEQSTDSKGTPECTIEASLEAITKRLYHKTIKESTDVELYHSLLALSKEKTSTRQVNVGDKKVYYISMEFLIGRLLGNNLINLGIYHEIDALLSSKGKSLASIEEVEPEPSLGNGGLGRLAACFLDSIATMGLPGAGIGLNYHYGLFKQEFHNKLQTATKDTWIDESSWLTQTDTSYEVSFSKFSVTSRLYQMDIVGYTDHAIKLNLFDLETLEEGLVKQGITFDKTKTNKNLTLFLYPDDSDEAGNLLRIYQQYFMVCNGAQLIIEEMKAAGHDLHRLWEHAVIQINDTHPTMVIPELIRIFTTQEGFSMDEAIEVVSKTCAYTNHTILAEALEKWPLAYFKKVVPQLVPIIKELDKRVRAAYRDPKVQIIDKQKRVHMAHIDIHYGFSVNGVAALHTQILKEKELHAFYQIYPEKFNNKTNGITFRRWLASCNKELDLYLEKLIGDEYKTNALALEQLLAYADDPKVLEDLAAIKQQKKRQLVSYVLEKEGIQLDEHSVFDIQIKRLHEYKRQQMNALYIIHKYLEVKAGKKPVRPITFLFGAKAAPAYIIAQDIIHLILVLQEIINHDPDVSDYLKVVMVTNYNVSYAEKLIPACDISEQISLASKEASGTGNMKFMLNGAVTLGTMDGANVEIHDLVGDENIFIFGQDADTVIEHYENEDYISREYYEDHPDIKAAVDFIVCKQARTVGRRENLERLYHEILSKDWFMTLLDLEEYIKVKDQALAAYEDREKWKKMCLNNIAKAGYFSADRTIEQYNRDVWHLSSF